MLRSRLLSGLAVLASNMLSRVADSIFWMARYMERTNGMLRLLRTNYVASQSEEKAFSWRSVLLTYGDMQPKQIDELEFSSQKVLEHLLHDKENNSSVINNRFTHTG